jgi:hypothetical protein
VCVKLSYLAGLVLISYCVNRAAIGSDDHKIIGSQSRNDSVGRKVATMMKR